MVLLSFKAGMRAKEIAAVTWAMVTNASGEIGDWIRLPNIATKGDSGRDIPLHPELKVALFALRACAREDGGRGHANRPVIYSERDTGLSANAVTVWFHLRYKECGLQGASSHSGRRTFITNAARLISTTGGSLKDVQKMAGHSSLAITQCYIDPSEDAQRKVVEMM